MFVTQGVPLCSIVFHWWERCSIEIHRNPRRRRDVENRNRTKNKKATAPDGDGYYGDGDDIAESDFLPTPGGDGDDNGKEGAYGAE